MSYIERLAEIRKSLNGEAAEPTPLEVAKAKIADLSERIGKAAEELKADAEKVSKADSENELAPNASELVAKMGTAQAKLTQIAAMLNQDPTHPDLRWKISRAVGLLQEHAELEALLGGFMKAADDAETSETPTEGETVEASKAFWPRDLAGVELDARGVVVKSESLWGPDSEKAPR